MSETLLMREIRYALNQVPGVRVWRNNVGFDEGRKIRYGLAVGSADLIGIAHGRFFAVEVKAPRGQTSPDQKCWLDFVRKLGGLVVVARSVDDALAAVRT